MGIQMPKLMPVGVIAFVFSCALFGASGAGAQEEEGAVKAETKPVAKASPALPAVPSAAEKAGDPVVDQARIAEIQLKVTELFSKQRRLEQAIKQRQEELKKNQGIKTKLDKVAAESGELQKQAQELREKANELANQARDVRKEGELKVWQEADPDLAEKMKEVLALFEERRSLSRELPALRRRPTGSRYRRPSHFRRQRSISPVAPAIQAKPGGRRPPTVLPPEKKPVGKK